MVEINTVPYHLVLSIKNKHAIVPIDQPNPDRHIDGSRAGHRIGRQGKATLGMAWHGMAQSLPEGAIRQVRMAADGKLPHTQLK